jgi:hypothetical protein
VNAQFATVHQDSLLYNRGMVSHSSHSHLDVLLPFGLPPKELARDLFRDLQAPALATLVTRSARHVAQSESASDDVFARSLPHESWLAKQFGLAASSSPAIAASLMRASDLHADAGFWFVLNPVHFHVARDHIVLTDPRQLQLTEADSRALFDMAQPVFADEGKTLLYGDATTWFLRADDWASLQTSTPDVASGHNIDIWMPRGEGERAWRKLQNEVQMLWFTSDVNEQRQAQGLKPVNSIWLWGGASASSQAQSPYTGTFHLNDWLRAFAGSRQADVETVVGTKHGLLVLDSLLESALNNDWGSWQLQLQQLENAWFAPLLRALQAGQLGSLTLLASDPTLLTTFTLGKRSLLKFWRKPSLSALTT